MPWIDNGLNTYRFYNNQRAIRRQFLHLLASLFIKREKSSKAINQAVVTFIGNSDVNFLSQCLRPSLLRAVEASNLMALTH